MTHELKAMQERIAEFLRMALPDGPYVLGAIPVEGGNPKVKTFKEDAEEAAAWAASMNADRAHNLYWIHNRLRAPAAKKPEEADVLEVLFLHVDCDPPKKLPCNAMSPEELAEWNAAERERLLDQLVRFDPEPTFIVDSGGGFQAFWRLDEPLYIDGDANRIAEVKAYNVQLRDVLGGDNCQSLEHLMRLPGTVNWPDKAKRDRGRVPRRAELIHDGGEARPLHDFTPAAPEKPKASSAAKVDLSDVPPGDLSKLPDHVSERTRMLIELGDDPDEPTRYSSKSEVMWAVTCDLVRAGCDDTLIASVLLEEGFGISDHPLRQKRSVEYVARQIERAREHAFDVTPGGRRVLSFASPYKTAQRLQIEVFASTIHVNGDWLAYRDGAYVLVEDRTMKAKLYRLLSDAAVAERKGDETIFHPFNPDPTKVAKVIEALQAVSHQEADAKAPPCWLDGAGPPPLEIISCRNGLLHLPRGELLPPTANFFTRNALELDYNPHAPPPEHWLAFLRDLWPGGPETEVLREVFGYLLLPDTRLHSIFMLKGPPRSGKGTILRVLENLIGRANVCAPSIAELGKDFGLEPLIGKQLAAITDMRFGKKADLGEIATNLLRISGEDTVSANRKGKTYWTGRLSVRFLILGNELPKFNENSPALAKRFVPLVLNESFDGKEDRQLMDKLLPELPGILNWAVNGWRRLWERGRFELPPASVEAVREIQELSSPVDAFLAECCDEGEGFHVPKDELFAAWRSWCIEAGRPAGSKGALTGLLATARPGLIRAGKTGTDTRVPSYMGVKLRAEVLAQRDRWQDRSGGDEGRYDPWH